MVTLPPDTAYCSACEACRLVERVGTVLPYVGTAVSVAAILQCGHRKAFIGHADQWPLANGALWEKVQ